MILLVNVQSCARIHALRWHTKSIYAKITQSLHCDIQNKREKEKHSVSSISSVAESNLDRLQKFDENLISQ